MTKLEPCPFCGASGQMLRLWNRVRCPDIYEINCGGCGACGPAEGGREEAAIRWNRRVLAVDAVGTVQLPRGVRIDNLTINV